MCNRPSAAGRIGAIALSRLTYRIFGVALFGCLLAACAGANSAVTSLQAANDAERLRLTDKCMYDQSRTAGPKEKIAPRCQCYARGMMAGGLRSSSDVMAACTRSDVSFAEAQPHRRRAKKQEAAPPPAAEPAATPPEPKP